MFHIFFPKVSKMATPGFLGEKGHWMTCTGGLAVTCASRAIKTKSFSLSGRIDILT
jgi:hypothetical protein